MRHDHDHRQRWASNLRAARHARGLTQFQISQDLGIDQQRISKWERGVQIPNDGMKIVVAQYFGMAPGDLFPWNLDATDDANGDDGQAVA